MSGLLRILAALASGTLFGAGLAISGMMDPARVLGFLDVFGVWDPSLAFVLGGAVLVSALAYQIVRRLDRPVLEEEFVLPPTTPVNLRLVVGSAIFGAGWGLAGFCPGPAIATLTLGLGTVVAFVAFMLAGMLVHDRIIAPWLNQRQVSS